jgi:hypothetical protein
VGCAVYSYLNNLLDFAKHVKGAGSIPASGFELATGFSLVIKGLRREMTTADRARAGITA